MHEMMVKMIMIWLEGPKIPNGIFLFFLSKLKKNNNNGIFWIPWIKEDSYGVNFNGGIEEAE